MTIPVVTIVREDVRCPLCEDQSPRCYGGARRGGLAYYRCRSSPCRARFKVRVHKIFSALHNDSMVPLTKNRQADISEPRSP